jgi:hypothetical protein
LDDCSELHGALRGADAPPFYILTSLDAVFDQEKVVGSSINQSQIVGSPKTQQQIYQLKLEI